MNDLKDIFKDYNFKINSLKHRGNVTILDTDRGIFVYKENSNNYDIYDYLNTRGFSYYPKSLNPKNSKYDLVEFIKDNNVLNVERVNDLIHVTGILHRTTSFHKEIDLDELKMMYENLVKEADYLMNYYHDLNNYIDSITFMSPVEYLLVSNLDLFYYLISFVKIESMNWYKEMQNKKIIRFSMIHDNLKLDHLLENNKPYLISWNKAHLDLPMKDLKTIYEENFYDLDLEDFIKEYEKEFRLTDDEKLFFLLNISLPKRIEFTKNTYLDCYNLSNYLVYLRKIASIVQKIEKKKQKN